MISHPVDGLGKGGAVAKWNNSSSSRSNKVPSTSHVCAYHRDSHRLGFQNGKGQSFLPGAQDGGAAGTQKLWDIHPKTEEMDAAFDAEFSCETSTGGL